MIKLIKENILYFRSFIRFDLINDSISLFKKFMIPISMIVIPFALPYIFTKTYFDFNEVRFSENSYFLKYLPDVLDWFLRPIYIGGLIMFLSNVITGKEMSYGRCIISGLRFWPKLFAVYLLTNILTIVGFIALIIPGFILIARFSYSDFLIVLEGNSSISALRNSCTLTTNKVPQIIGSYLMLSAPLLIIYFIVRFPLSALFYRGFFPSILTDLIVTIFSTLFMILFYRFYCLSVMERHNHTLAADS